MKAGNFVVGKENFEASKFSTINQVFQIEASLLNARQRLIVRVNESHGLGAWSGSHVSNMRKNFGIKLAGGEKRLGGGGLSVLLSDRRFYCGLCSAAIQDLLLHKFGFFPFSTAFLLSSGSLFNKTNGSLFPNSCHISMHFSFKISPIKYVQ